MRCDKRHRPGRASTAARIGDDGSDGRSHREEPTHDGNRQRNRRRDAQLETSLRSYGSFAIDGDVLVYDRENTERWVQSDTAVGLGEMR